jgi:GTPase SAR1 family protein
MNQVIKIIVVGDGITGKTSLVKMYKSSGLSDFTVSKLYKSNSKTHDPTMGVEISNVTKENLTLNIWDCGGIYKGLEDGYYIGSDAAIIVCNEDTIKNSITQNIKNIRRVCEFIPIVLCYNFSKVSKKIRFQDQNYFVNVTYNICTKDGYNVDKPFQYIINKLKKSSLKSSDLTNDQLFKDVIHVSLSPPKTLSPTNNIQNNEREECKSLSNFKCDIM